MDSVRDRLDEIQENIMSRLKTFQRATVERVAQLFESDTQRVLVSDEVGLGKTLIARGVIAKFANMASKSEKYKDKKVIKVVYVCSNSAIAEQNLNKLKITDELAVDGITNSRLSMQHLKIAMQELDPDLEKKYIQLIPLTPNTSFKIVNSEGIVNERALMFTILKKTKLFDENKLRELMTFRAKKYWQWYEDEYEKNVKICDGETGDYSRGVCEAILRELQSMHDGTTLYEKLEKYCRGEYTGSRTALIVKLRTAFANISIDRLQPDLVIMDEFQRFKDLMSDKCENETQMLAKKFFSDNNCKMLLLSATPYKMYSTLDEIEDKNVDEHYEEFHKVVKFLNLTDSADMEFRKVWGDYSMQLKEYVSGNQANLQCKICAEEKLYSHICRTERMRAERTADIIDDTSVGSALEVSEADIKSYVQMQELLDEISPGYNAPIDYVKSCPYLLSFMRDYKLKNKIETYFKSNVDDVEKLKKNTFFIDKRRLKRYDEIPCNNARLEDIMSRTLADNAELLLWIPPSKCYYESQGPFSGAGDFSKTLIFSSWEMVPRMLASLISYEVERKTIAKLANSEGKKINYFVNDQEDGKEGNGKRKYPLPKLNFTLKSDGKENDEPATMSLFCLIYPSKFLAGCFNPLESLNKRQSLEDITSDIKGKISAQLSKYEFSESGKEDRRWYHVAPLLLDGGEYGIQYARKALELYQESGDDDEKRKKGFVKHLQKLLRICEDIKSGKKLDLERPPADLEDVLANMAIASPAICVLRTYRRYYKDFNCACASQIARHFLNRMNTPESTAVIELCFGKDGDKKNDDDKTEAFWQNVLEYCKAGNFQAMFDEYAHLVSNGISGSGEKAFSELHREISQAFANVRTTMYKVDTYDTFVARMREDVDKSVRIRSHFASAFTKGDDSNKDSDRKKTLRNAFNSPFRPFVLASTSIGQEGLDFHNYCRRIVHWNLPSNPIDLEQREGRINRYECLAVRQNIAKRYGCGTDFHEDIWREMFDKAMSEREEGDSQLVPYWGVPEPDQSNAQTMIKIERIVPMYPFSHDEASYRRLMKILNLYRLTLGQARQEELIEYVMSNRESDKSLKDWFINLSPHFREKK